MKPRTAILTGLTAALVSVQAVRSTADYRRALREVRAERPYCEHALQGCPWTNGMRVVPHHKIPVWKAPWLAATKTNLIMLCDPADCRTNGCHYRCGHGGKGWRGVGDWATCRNQQKRK